MCSKVENVHNMCCVIPKEKAVSNFDNIKHLDKRAFFFHLFLYCMFAFKSNAQVFTITNQKTAGISQTGKL